MTWDITRGSSLPVDDSGPRGRPLQGSLGDLRGDGRPAEAGRFRHVHQVRNRRLDHGRQGAAVPGREQSVRQARRRHRRLGVRFHRRPAERRVQGEGPCRNREERVPRGQGHHPGSPFRPHRRPPRRRDRVRLFRGDQQGPDGRGARPLRRRPARHQHRTRRGGRQAARRGTRSDAHPLPYGRQSIAWNRPKELQIKSNR